MAATALATPPESTYVRKLFASAVLIALVLGARGVRAADDASAGYVAVRPSLVKVWAFDRAGRPTESGSGVVVDSNAQRSLVLTASHVVAGAASIRIDLSRDQHDISAHIERTGPRDLTLLTIDRGGLRAARFAPRSHPVVEGNLVAVAGYVKNDELIGIVGQEPRVLFPGTIASRPENGLYLELENVHIEEGLSGGPVFDPGTGEVLGIVTSRTSDQRGGFADSGTLVVVPFLRANDIAAGAAPPVAPAHIAAVAPVAPAPAVAPLPQAPLPRFVAIASPAVQPRPVPTLEALLSVAAPRDPDGAIVSWQAGETQPKRFVFVRDGCRIAVTIDVNSLQFVVAHAALVQPHHHGSLLVITLQQRAAATDACANVADEEPADAAYDPTAMSFSGNHVTMRFVYAGDPEASDRFPSDASLDADLSGDSVTATVQFFDRDWSGSFALPLERTALASVSSTW
jgi:S1-C subfamily serine protease